NNFFLALGIYKRAHSLSGGFASLGALVGEKVQSAMHVGILLGIRTLTPIEDLLWFLSRGRVIEIDQRLAIDLHCESGKIRPDFGDVVGAVADRWMHELLPRAQPPKCREHQGVADALMCDLLDRLVDEGL